MDVSPQQLVYVEQTRRALLDAAESHFISSGYRTTSLDAVAEAARFTKGALHRHFANKEAVFTAVLDRVQREAVEQIAFAPALGLAADDDPREARRTALARVEQLLSGLRS